MLAEEAGQIDLSGTLFYKLMTICGSFLKTNEGKPKQVCWVEQTRSVALADDQKNELLAGLDERAVIDREDGRMMAIGLQFRMKGLNKGLPKSLKQLRADCSAL